MNIKDKLNALAAEMDAKPSSTPRIAAKTLELLADLKEGSAIVPENVMENLDNLTQRNILLSFCVMTLQVAAAKIEKS